MKNFIIILMPLLLGYNITQSQGCIMVRNISGFGQYNLADNAFTNSEWILNVNNRYFKAYRDFKGTTDQKTPAKDQSIVKSFTTDITLSRLLNHGWSIDVSLPFAANSRSATIEHGGAGTPRHVTHSFGIGDIRITAYKWLLSPTVVQKGNIQLGLGVKLPTGDYKYQDYFYRNDSTKVLAPLNASISLGDGGTGLITEFNTFYFFTKAISFYGNFYYLINPRDESGVSTTNGKTPTAIQIKVGSDVYSVPDIYSIRAGFNFNLNKFSASLGFRNEGVPVRDLFGGNNGLRRPGHNLSLEPGVLYRLKKVSLYVYVPTIIQRKIRQNLTDKRISEITGVYTIGAGGSGDYSIFVGAQFKL